MSLIRILLIDHQPAFVARTIDFLKWQPHLKVVATANDANWGLLEAQVLQIDLVLVDLELRGLGGLETIRRLRALLPVAGIIALAANDQNGHEQALAAGAEGFVFKSRVAEDLLGVITQVARTRDLR
jgi:two-component system nitrate/nitrite response regulator NarL